MVGGAEPTIVDTPPSGAASKREIVREVGQLALVLPSMVNQALQANDRAKYYLTLLQAAATHARRPDRATPSLRGERLAAGINDQWLDRVVESAEARTDDDRFVAPRAGEIHDALLDAIDDMLRPLAVIDVQQSPDRARLEGLRRQAPDFAGDCVPYDYVERATSADRSVGDSLHLLVMDGHRALNRLQTRIATETFRGASVYDVDDDDRELIGAFMSGLHRTAPLKFDHSGLGTTATHVAGRLLVQNDIGLTEAHVLVVTVEGLAATVTYTDVHLPRLLFFQNMLDRFDVDWSSTERRDGGDLGTHHLATGRFEAADRDELAAYLVHLGSRLVFLIDWNRARKRLAPLIGKPGAIELLAWAADAELGHRAFLELGGERLVFAAIEGAMKVPPPYGTPLREVLGPSATVAVLQSALRTTALGLLEGKSHRLIRDEFRVEMLGHLHAAQHQVLEATCAHGSLVVEAAQALHASIVSLTDDEGIPFAQRASDRARRWEHRADEIVVATRSAARRSTASDAAAAQLVTQDDAIDATEDALFQLTLLSPEAAPVVQPLLEPLASISVLAAQEHLKALELALLVLDGARPDDVEDFLLAVDRVVGLEHDADRADRVARAAITIEAPDFRTLQVANDVARAVESASDALMRSALQLRDRVLAEVITR